ncbi:MAG: membrane integrity-associated transporter subunit PqiC [Nitrospiraceae bacterium]|jgi:uncharacterized lipoprotein YmbA|nr:MAG: membrane integrity-associated transporter subunit PqiC [Nitrospiraceae bacterium]
MKNNLLHYSGFFIVAVLFIVLAGCASTDPARFYTLNSALDTNAQTQQADMKDNMAIGIGPVKLPDYLDRPQIVTRSSANEIMIDEFHRWAGSLEGDISRLIMENLSILLFTDRAFLFPWKSSVPVDYQVTVEVSRFDGEPGNQAVLHAQWTLFNYHDRKMLLTKKSMYTEETGGNDYAAFVQAMGKTLESLSKDIADEIAKVSR